MREMLRALTTSEAVLGRIEGFDRRYAGHWMEWLRVSQVCDFRIAPIPDLVVIEFAGIMRRWQACRPRPVRSVTELQKTLDSAIEPLRLMGSASLRCFNAPQESLKGAIRSLWQTFEDGLCLNASATEVGVSKAILLVTKGRIGPAFDSNVKRALRTPGRMDCMAYMAALAEIAYWLSDFEANEGTTVERLAEQARRPAEVGRVVDMVLGPRGPSKTRVAGKQSAAGPFAY